MVSKLLQRTKSRNEFRRFHFYQIRFHMFDDSVAHCRGQKIDNRRVNFSRCGERPSFLPIERNDFGNLIGKLFMNAAVRFGCQLRTLGNGARSMMSACAVGDREAAGQIAHPRNRLLAASALFLRTERSKLHATFLPGFLTGLSLRAADELEQTTSASAKIDVVARPEFFWPSEETVWVHCVENQLPLEMLLTGQDKGDRFVMRIDQQQKCVITNCLALKIRNIAGIATKQHANTANEWRRPFFVGHFAHAGIEPHHVAILGAAYPPTLKKFRPAKHRMRIAKRN